MRAAENLGQFAPTRGSQFILELVPSEESNEGSIYIADGGKSSIVREAVRSVAMT